jgi:hypothetical protein
MVFHIMQQYFSCIVWLILYALSHNVVLSILRNARDLNSQRTSVVIGTDCIGTCSLN